MRRLPDWGRGMKNARGAAGGKARAAKLSARRRKSIARKAAQARWNPRGPEVGTTCQAEETAPGRVACIPCGLSWPMDDPAYPRCPRLADLRAMPPIQGGLEERARAIVHTLLHGGQRADFDETLRNRPDWQAYVGFVTDQLIAACSEVA